MRKTLSFLLASMIPASAVEIRVATYNIGAHFTTEGFPDYSLGDPGTSDHDSVRDVLDRIDADVVALQEIASADVSGAPDDLDALAASLGYPYLYVAPVSAASPLPGPIDTTLRVSFLSRYPFLSTNSVRSPEGTKELTRLHPVVKVDVPGTTRDLLLISAHLKSGTAAADKFRRAVDFKRLVGHFNGLGLTNDDNYIIMGDFNLSSSNATYNAFPADMPASYSLGTDIPFPVAYSTNPLSYFTSPSVTKLDPRQVNGSAATFQSGSSIDLMMVSPAIAGRPLEKEVYNSTLDTSNSVGLSKAGSPLASGTSAAASDHYAVFADLELDADFPNLDLALSTSTLSEGQPDGTATLTVTLPTIRASAVTITLSSDDLGAMPVSPSIIIPAGSLSGSTAVRTPRNFFTDPARSVTFTATASGYDPDSTLLHLLDTDGPYVIASAGQPVTEQFTTFDGSHDPAPWTTSGGLTWRASDTGTSTTGELRSYGTGTDGSLGILPNGTGTTATTTFVNQSGAPLTGLQIGFDVEQWRAALNGAADSLSASVYFDGQTFPLPTLSHVASQNLPTGPIAGGLTTAKSASLSGLSIPSGSSFELRIAFTAAAGVPPSNVFLNEFHYDNIGTDSNEFIEITVAPGFAGQLSDIDVVLYNGNAASAAVPYGNTFNLASFAPGDTSGGYRFYSITLPQDGIQNGDRDGFAVVNHTTNQVLQLISYEGTFTATTGPAAGMTSTAISPTQNSNNTATGSSIGLSGTGGIPGDFTWAATSGTNTKGSANVGQTFSSAAPSQGLAIDNLSVTGISEGDFDNDGIANSLDPDDDNDGQSDLDELAFGTNPLDPSTSFRPIVTNSGGFTLSFPGASGISYTLETSINLSDWDTLSVHPGAGQTVVVPLPITEDVMFFRVKAGS